MDDEHQFTGSLQLSGSTTNESYIIGTNVGIGTTDPEQSLHVEGAAETWIQIESANNSSAGLKLVRSGTGNGDFSIANNGGMLEIRGHDDIPGNAGTLWFDMSNSTGAVWFAGDVDLAATKKLYLDGGTHTYITEASSDQVRIYAGNIEGLRIGTSYAYSPNDFQIEATKKLYFDGGSNTSLAESSGDNLRAIVGGVSILDITTTSISGSSTSTGSFAHLDIQQTNASGLNEFIKIKSRGSAAINGIGLGSGNADLVLYADKDSATDGNIIFQVNGSEQFRITENNLISGSSSSTGSFGKL